MAKNICVGSKMVLTAMILQIQDNDISILYEISMNMLGYLRDNITLLHKNHQIMGFYDIINI